MRRTVCLVLLCLLLIGGAYPAHAAASIRVVIDGRVLEFPDVQPRIQDGRVLVPTRALAEGLGAKVTWYPNSRTIYLTNIRHSAQIAVGSTHSWSDTWKFELDVPPIIMDGRTMLPARFVAEALGAAVAWNPTTQTVTITNRQDTFYTPDELKQAAAYLTPFVEVDDSGQFHLDRPDGIWLPVSPSALRQLRDSMRAINQSVSQIPSNALEWEPADELTLLAAKRLDLRVGGPDWDGWKEPVFTVADARQPMTRVRVYWWLSKWYIDEDTANEIKWLLAKRVLSEQFAVSVLNRLPKRTPLSIGLEYASYLISAEALYLDQCITRAKGRGSLCTCCTPGIMAGASQGR